MKAYLPDQQDPHPHRQKGGRGGRRQRGHGCRPLRPASGCRDVYIVYRRGMAELPARKEEVEHAEEEGIDLQDPVQPRGDPRRRRGLRQAPCTCIEMELGEPDASGRRRPIEKKGSEFELDVDTVIMSLGTSPNPLIRSTTPGLETNKHGCIVTERRRGQDQP